MFELGGMRLTFDKATVIVKDDRLTSHSTPAAFDTSCTKRSALWKDRDLQAELAKKLKGTAEDEVARLLRPETLRSVQSAQITTQPSRKKTSSLRNEASQGSVIAPKERH